MEKSDILKVNKLVFEYVLNLDDLQLKQLLDGVKVLTLKDGQVDKNNLVDKKKLVKEPRTNKEKAKDNKAEKSSESNILGEALIKLNSFLTKEEALDYLKNSGLKVKELKAIAKQAEIFVKSKSKKDEIIDKLVEGTVGVKIKMKILREG
ncbi:hypothetical protein [Clostridium disporicum]|uniref:Uncharacterized protein n=1 Tax=Clostridium disporicum TaxID=84024 RepID=A0A174H3N9_9CLOT|nr:hypothetical protein [Clostridium disporicum]CUO69463.1 Uncharacterised protein [Clostridium disporicum]